MADGSSPQELLDVAVELAHRAGDLLLTRFGEPASGLGAKTTPTDLVSDADRDAESLIRRSLRDWRGQDGIVGEEGSDRATTSGITWVVDPLDGTVNFLYGIPVWSVSVAALDEEGALCGAVFDPSKKESFTAVRGGGAALNGRPIAVSGATRIDQTMLATGFAYDAGLRAVQAELIARMLPKVRDIRRLGSAALDLCSVALGRVDAYYEAPTEAWDRAAGELVVIEAGGVVTHVPSPTGAGMGVVASSPGIHDDLVRLVTAG